MNIRIFTSTLLASFLAISQARSADTASCGPIIFNELERAGKLYVFEIASVCQLQSVSEADLLKRYQLSIKDRDTVTVLSANNIESGSTALSIVENLSTQHGDMTIYGNINITQDTNTSLSYRHTSGKISATGAAANTRLVIESADLVKEGSLYQVKIAKTLHIRKPWYAPGGIFKKEVSKGLKKDMKVILHRHLDVLSAK